MNEGEGEGEGVGGGLESECLGTILQCATVMKKHVDSLMTCNQLLQTQTSSVNTSQKNPICNSTLTVEDYVIEIA